MNPTVSHSPSSPTDYRLLSLERRMAPLREQIIHHSLYTHLRSVESVQLFMEHHIFAVWDFMSLLKSLQQQLTCVETAWVPTKHRAARRLINEIVVAEESDVDLHGQPAITNCIWTPCVRQGQILVPWGTLSTPFNGGFN